MTAVIFNLLVVRLHKVSILLNAYKLQDCFWLLFQVIMLIVILYLFAYLWFLQNIVEVFLDSFIKLVEYGLELSETSWLPL